MSDPTQTPPAATAAASLRELRQALMDCMVRDRSGLERRLGGLERRLRQGRPVDRGLAAVAEAVAASRAEAAARRGAVRDLEYPPELPVSGARESILAALAEHPVVVVCGDTGSGKSTQLPKLCLEAGLGVYGQVGHTQPRRIAARSLSLRVAEELGTRVGQGVGYKVRFQDQTGPRTLVKLMTDGILLAETRSDPDLRAYGAVIVDEAHERSLNIDFLLGYLKRLLPRRPDLRVVVTSATIDPQRLAEHFDGAPVVQVSGRTFPVEHRYRSLLSGGGAQEAPEMPEAVADAVAELAAEGPGDILVFLPGEREIRESAEALRKRHPPQSEVLPLFARLSLAEQQRVFSPGGRRRIVLATNVAETSLTVPGIRYVVDSGLARVSRYSARSKVQRLPVEPVSQASADQRAGRCGRVAPGICIRLYGEDDYHARPHYTDPEIRRTNLAAVILQMADLGLGPLERYPFVDPPEPRFIRDGHRLLEELGAMDGEGALTPLGRRLAHLPLDPRLGRMVVEAEAQGCLREVLIIASALAVQDPRERPADRREKADAAHAELADPRSDFLSLVRLWDFYHDAGRRLSRSKLQGLCRERFLSYPRMREWHDVHQQLLAQLHDRGVRINGEPADYPVVHRALASGLLSHLARRERDRDYVGARGVRLQLHPSSPLARRGPKWVLAAELVETRRLYARTLARIEPAWVEPVAGHLLKRRYSEPHWDRRSGRVVATESATLYGLPLVSGRRVDYGRIDPAGARAVFIREALVGGDYRGDAPFLEHNQALVAELEGLEHKARRRDVVVAPEDLEALYGARLGPEVHDARSLERWRRRAERNDPRCLYFPREALTANLPEYLTAERYPDTLEVDGQPLALRYRFEPGAEDDGVTLTVPLALLNRVDAARAEWLVPGLLEEKITRLLRGLPKALRRRFVPVPDFARACLESIPLYSEALLPALSRELRRMTGTQVPLDAWGPSDLPEHLRMGFALVDGEGTVLDRGRDLAALRERWGQAARREFSARGGHPWRRSGIVRWDFPDLPERVEVQEGGLSLIGYPALVDRGADCALELFDDPREARLRHRAGLRRLFALELGPVLRRLERAIPGREALCLRYGQLPPPAPGPLLALGAERPRGDCRDLGRALGLAAVARCCMDEAGEVRTREAFEARLSAGRGALGARLDELAALVADILERRRQLLGSLPEGATGPRGAGAADIQGQLEGLLFLGFPLAVPPYWLRQYPRYLDALSRRLQRLEDQPERDARLAARLAPLEGAYRSLDATVAEGAAAGELETLGWHLQELRVALFAQELKTAVPVSLKRLEKRLGELAVSLRSSDAKRALEAGGG